ncbi:MAG: hypothetical protein GKR87_07165 [Kiritimatiellae bacterium]|nr:hypothetical protein [Kiritimatiellia bacterium]
MGISVAGWGCNCPPYSAVGECKKEDPPMSAQVNLSMSGVDESNEETVGGFICLSNKVFLSLFVNSSDNAGIVHLNILSVGSKAALHGILT